MGASTYFRMLKAGRCCPCTKQAVECINNGTKGTNWVATKQIQFGGVSILPGSACGQGTGVCDNKLNIPIVLDSVVSGNYPPNCEWRYSFDTSDVNCQTMELILGLEDRGAGLTRWALDFVVDDISDFQWTSADLAAPINIGTSTPPLNGTYNNYVFGIPPGGFCAFDDITAAVVA